MQERTREREKRWGNVTQEGSDKTFHGESLRHYVVGEKRDPRARKITITVQFDITYHFWSSAGLSNLGRVGIFKSREFSLIFAKFSVMNWVDQLRDETWLYATLPACDVSPSLNKSLPLCNFYDAIIITWIL